MVKKTMKDIEAEGNEAVFDEFGNPKGKLADRHLSSTVCDPNAKWLADGSVSVREQGGLNSLLL